MCNRFHPHCLYRGETKEKPSCMHGSAYNPNNQEGIQPEEVNYWLAPPQSFSRARTSSWTLPPRAPVPAQTVPMIWRFSTQLRPKPPSHQTPAPVTSCAYGLVGFHQIIFSRKLPSLLRQPQMIQSYFLRKGTFCLKLTPEHQEEIKDCILSHLNLLLCWTSSLDFMDSNSNISGARWGFTQHLYPTTKSRVPC